MLYFRYNYFRVVSGHQLCCLKIKTVPKSISQVHLSTNQILTACLCVYVCVWRSSIVAPNQGFPKVVRVDPLGYTGEMAGVRLDLFSCLDEFWKYVRNTEVHQRENNFQSGLRGKKLGNLCPKRIKWFQRSILFSFFCFNVDVIELVMLNWDLWSV